MITFTQQQHETLAAGSRPITRAVDPSANVEYVVIRADAFAEMFPLLGVDSISASMNEAMAEDDAHDPYLEGYQTRSRDCA